MTLSVRLSEEDESLLEIAAHSLGKNMYLISSFMELQFFNENAIT